MLHIRASTVFRIKNIPAKFEVPDLERILREQLSDDECGVKINTTFVPSCYRAQCGTKWALVDFKPMPRFLLDVSSDKTKSLKYYLELEDGQILSIDINFYGFTQLYDVQEGQEIAADIIAITGLGGHAYGSWRGKQTKKMWLMDFLAKDLPNCRTMIYGYDSNLESRGIHTLADYKQQFLMQIAQIRRSEDSLVEAATRKGKIEAFKDVGNEYLVAATCAVMFFGTPHRGILMEDLRKMLEDDIHSPRVGLLDEIENSLNLEPSLNEFIKLAEDFKIVSFYERIQTPEVKKTSEHGWKRTGDYKTTLDTDSALLHLSKLLEETIPVDSDHTSMVKFEDNLDTTYRYVVERIAKYVETASDHVKERFRAIDERTAGKLKESSTNSSFSSGSTSQDSTVIPKPESSRTSIDNINTGLSQSVKTRKVKTKYPSTDEVEDSLSDPQPPPKQMLPKVGLWGIILSFARAISKMKIAAKKAAAVEAERIISENDIIPATVDDPVPEDKSGKKKESSAPSTSQESTVTPKPKRRRSSFDSITSPGLSESIERPSGNSKYSSTDAGEDTSSDSQPLSNPGSPRVGLWGRILSFSRAISRMKIAAKKAAAAQAEQTISEKSKMPAKVTDSVPEYKTSKQKESSTRSVYTNGSAAQDSTVTRKHETNSTGFESTVGVGLSQSLETGKGQTKSSPMDPVEVEDASPHPPSPLKPEKPKAQTWSGVLSVARAISKMKIAAKKTAALEAEKTISANSKMPPKATDSVPSFRAGGKEGSIRRPNFSNGSNPQDSTVIPKPERGSTRLDSTTGVDASQTIETGLKGKTKSSSMGEGEDASSDPQLHLPLNPEQHKAQSWGKVLSVARAISKMKIAAKKATATEAAQAFSENGKAVPAVAHSVPQDQAGKKAESSNITTPFRRNLTAQELSVIPNPETSGTSFHCPIRPVAPESVESEKTTTKYSSTDDGEDATSEPQPPLQKDEPKARSWGSVLSFARAISKMKIAAQNSTTTKAEGTVSEPNGKILSNVDDAVLEDEDDKKKESITTFYLSRDSHAQESTVVPKPKNSSTSFDSTIGVGLSRSVETRNGKTKSSWTDECKDVPPDHKPAPKANPPNAQSWRGILSFARAISKMKISVEKAAAIQTETAMPETGKMPSRDHKFTDSVPEKAGKQKEARKKPFFSRGSTVQDSTVIPKPEDTKTSFDTTASNSMYESVEIRKGKVQCSSLDQGDASPSDPERCPQSFRDRSSTRMPRPGKRGLHRSFSSSVLNTTSDNKRFFTSLLWGKSNGSTQSMPAASSMVESETVNRSRDINGPSCLEQKESDMLRGRTSKSSMKRFQSRESSIVED
ncbi:hypothetical protein RUND412_006716 [Rhizina undulata]